MLDGESPFPVAVREQGVSSREHKVSRREQLVQSHYHRHRSDPLIDLEEEEGEEEEKDEFTSGFTNSWAITAQPHDERVRKHAYNVIPSSLSTFIFRNTHCLQFLTKLHLTSFPM